MLEAARARALTHYYELFPPLESGLGSERHKQRRRYASKTLLYLYSPLESQSTLSLSFLSARLLVARSRSTDGLFYRRISGALITGTPGERARTHARYRGNARRQRVSATVVRSVLAVPDPLVRVIAAAAARRCENSRCTIGPRAPTGPPSRLIFAATPHCQTRTTTERPSDD